MVFAPGDKFKVIARGDRVNVCVRGDEAMVFPQGGKVQESGFRDPKPRAIPEFGNPKPPLQHSKIVQNHWTPQDTSTPRGVTLAPQRFIP
jgi:hypothetical protein